MTVVCAPTTIAEKQRILRTLMIACVVLLAVGVAVAGSVSYPSLASSAALANTTSSLGTSYPLFSDADDDFDEDGGDAQLAVWGLVLLMGPRLGWLLWLLYGQAKLHSVFNSPLERPG